MFRVNSIDVPATIIQEGDIEFFSQKFRWLSSSADRWSRNVGSQFTFLQRYIHCTAPKCGSFESSFWQHSHHSLQCSYWTDPSKNSASPVVYFLNWFIKSIRWFKTDRPTLNCESGLHLVLTKQTEFIHERIFQNRTPYAEWRWQIFTG